MRSGWGRRSRVTGRWMRRRVACRPLQRVVELGARLGAGLVFAIGASAAGRGWEPMPLPLPQPPERVDAASSWPGVYAVAPDLASCRTGRLAAAEAARVLALLNDIRRLHGLGPVDWDATQEEAVMRAALLFAANGQLSHTPSAHWRCLSVAGSLGAASSNIHLWVGSAGSLPRSSEEVLIGFLTDIGNRESGNIGHRRWMLDPFLKRVAFGRVGARAGAMLHDGAALSVVEAAGGMSDLRGLPGLGGSARADHWAWPQGAYPARYFHPEAFLSFSAIVDLTERAANAAVDYRGASVSVRRADGRPLVVSQLSFDHHGYGLPNSLQFKAAGIEPDVEHEVLIQGVRAAGAPRDYRYRFRIVP